MKQIWPNYSYSPTTNVLTLTGLNIDRDQLLLVTAADRGRIMYNFADSSVTASAFTSGANTALTLVATTAGLTTTAALVIYYDDQLQSTSVSISNLPSTQTIAGTVTVSNAVELAQALLAQSASYASLDVNIGGVSSVTLPISGTVTIGSALPAGTNRIGVVTIGAGTVTIGAGTAQIGSVTASGTVTANIGGIANSVTLPVRLIAERTGGAPTGEDTLLTCNSNGMLLVDAQSAGTSVLGFDGNAFVQIKPVSGSSVTIGNSVTISSLPALVAGTAQIGSVTASISGTVPISISSVTIGSCVTHGVTIANTVVTFYPAQGTTVSNTNFTSITSSTSLVAADSGREVLTVFNEGAGNLHISPGATCTTISYQVRLSSGDYWECPQGQLSLAHTAVFATAGTARVTQVS